MFTWANNHIHGWWKLTGTGTAVGKFVLSSLLTWRQRWCHSFELFVAMITSAVRVVRLCTWTHTNSHCVALLNTLRREQMDMFALRRSAAVAMRCSRLQQSSATPDAATATATAHLTVLTLGRLMMTSSCLSCWFDEDWFICWTIPLFHVSLNNWAIYWTGYTCTPADCNCCCSLDSVHNPFKVQFRHMVTFWMFSARDA